MAAPKATDPHRLYIALMTEVNVRLSWIEYAAQGRTGMDAPLVREFGYLQLRMICELIALGCLALHGEVPATRSVRLQGSFSADEVMKGLARLHPDFFPQAVLEPISLPTGVKHFEVRQEGHMTREELLNLYNRHCGDALHRGSYKNLLKPRPPIQKNFPELMNPAQRIINLLAIHRIGLLGGQTQLICWMHHGPNSGVRVSVARAVTEPIPEKP